MSKQMITVIDYGLGNVKSIINGLVQLGAAYSLTRNPREIMNASACILPGVGAFARGMKALESTNLIPVLREFVGTGKPLLGICLGMQLFFDESDEFGSWSGLGLIPGRVELLRNEGPSKLKLPHVCWNEVKLKSSSRWKNSIMSKVGDHSSLYFVHSYVAKPLDESDILSTTNYNGVEFCSAVQHENITGVQFHPEKSGPLGLSILDEFISMRGSV